MNFVLQADPSHVLDLGQFSCQTVNVSLSAVNKRTMSDFSPPAQLTIYGGTLHILLYCTVHCFVVFCNTANTCFKG